ncbi:hypothetical protein F5Y03DRAFT_130614 [Xylaria venustula]|nr:hypothetical protein F5Y03DRAFT_130614 [Xylaria venustula]
MMLYARIHSDMIPRPASGSIGRCRRARYHTIPQKHRKVIRRWTKNTTLFLSLVSMGVWFCWPFFAPRCKDTWWTVPTRHARVGAIRIFPMREKERVRNEDGWKEYIKGRLWVQSFWRWIRRMLAGGQDERSAGKAGSEAFEGLESCNMVCVR